MNIFFISYYLREIFLFRPYNIFALSSVFDPRMVWINLLIKGTTWWIYTF